jgi:hypothetical protein
MTEVDLENYKQTLATFLEEYTKYTHSAGISSIAMRAELRTRLQRKITLVNRIIDQVHGGAVYTMGNKTISFHETLGFTLTKGASENQFWDNAKEYVIRIINEGIGSIENSTMLSKEIEPVLPIKDETLRKRCLDLLQAPRNFDRVINQATQVLEARLRDSVSYEKLCEVIPEAKEHIGEPLANKLLSPNKPVIVISDKQTERAAFHKIVVGIIAYLRNPSHHFLDDKTEWSLAWSVVGIIDSLLSELANSYIAEDSEDNKGQTK